MTEPKKPPRIRNKEAEKEYTRKWRAKKPVANLFSRLKGNAGFHSRNMTLTLEQVEQIIAPMVCSVTGHPLAWEWTGQGDNPWGPSIDRIDCTKGYDFDNVRLVCWAYNIARRNWPDEIVLEMAQTLLKRRSCE